MTIRKPPQQRATMATRYRVTGKKYPRPYQPCHDFLQAFNMLGGEASIAEVFNYMRQKKWRRPMGGPLTEDVMRTDVVALARHRCLTRLTD